ncbi:Qor NADPH,quinone reductase and related Zn-dependent oxidoreductases [Burkholderiaceae bacterium]|jgi:NADPH2:quinone reductase
MKYISHGVGGGPEVLVPAQTDVPVLSPGEVLIKVAFAGVNRPDCSQRSGRYPPPKGASPIMGLEVSGHIAAVGEGVRGWALGDRVCALCNGGGYADFVAVPASQALPIPQGMGLLQAAALPENYFTVWVNLFLRGHLKAGETLLVHGGSSGIGLTAIQLAKAFGAKVYCTTGSVEKNMACLKAGADAAINYKTQDFVTETLGLTQGQGVDIVLDMVGGDYVDRNLKVLAVEGRLIQIAFLQGAKVNVDLTSLMVKRIAFTGSTLRPRTIEDKAHIAQSLQEHVWPLLGQGKALPIIDRVFEMDDASLAHGLMESSVHVGKIMLKIHGDEFK